MYQRAKFPQVLAACGIHYSNESRTLFNYQDLWRSCQQQQPPTKVYISRAGYHTRVTTIWWFERCRRFSSTSTNLHRTFCASPRAARFDSSGISTSPRVSSTAHRVPSAWSIGHLQQCRRASSAEARTSYGVLHRLPVSRVSRVSEVAGHQ